MSTTRSHPPEAGAFRSTAASPPSGAIDIRAFQQRDAQAVVDLVLGIQTAEFGLPISAADQPDLLDVPGHYLRGGGGFWVATDRGAVVGCVGLLRIPGGQGVLRKMFVATTHRGTAPGVARALLQAALDRCRARAIGILWLGTTAAFGAAQRFYAREGFEKVADDQLPAEFPRMAVDTLFFRRAIDASGSAAC